jgi:hypothetical protein
MKFFYISSKVDSANNKVIHERDCQSIPSIYDRDYLGPFNSALEASRTASQKATNLTICPTCGSLTEIYSYSSLQSFEECDKYDSARFIKICNNTNDAST